VASFEIDVKQFEEVTEQIIRFADRNEAIDLIDSYLTGEGGDLIKQGIHDLLPVSGRKWRGKKAAAKSTDPFKKTPGSLSVRVHTTGNYHYLYFPDDGSSTIRHYGDQQFMLQGAEDKAENIGTHIINKLIEKLEG